MPLEPLITMGASVLEPELNMRVSFTLVPEDMFSDKSSADFLDPAEDKVWALIQDAGTGDAQFFSISVNGTKSIVCFKEEATARHCCDELHKRGTPLRLLCTFCLRKCLTPLTSSTATSSRCAL